MEGININGVAEHLFSLGFWMFVVVIIGISLLRHEDAHSYRQLSVAGWTSIFASPGIVAGGWLFERRYDDVFYPMLAASGMLLCLGIGLVLCAAVLKRVGN